MTITESAEALRDLYSETITTIERLAREGHGPTFTQRSVGAGYTHLGIGNTTEDFCHAIIALGKMTDKGNGYEEKNHHQEARQAKENG